MEHRDAALLAQWTEHRDSDAFMALVLRHSSMVYSTCLRVLGNPSDAEEVTQECFLELSQAAGRVRKTLAGWLHSVAIKRSAMRVRSETRRRGREKAYSENRPIQIEPDWEDVRPHLDACIADLPEPLRAVVVTRFLEGLTYEEASRRLGMPVSTIQYRIRKGLEQLRKLLAKRGVVSSTSALLALLGAGAAEGASVPAELTASLGAIALAKGATGAGTATVAAGGGPLAMKYVIAGVVAVIALTGLGVASRVYRAEPAGKSQPTTADASLAMPIKPPEDATSPPQTTEPVVTAQAAPEDPGSTPVENVSGASISGRVYDVTTGRGIQGIMIRRPYGGGRTETDASGRYKLSGVPHGQIELNLEDTVPYINPNPLGHCVHLVDLDPEQHLENVDFPLEKGVELTGIVVNKSGTPFVDGIVYMNGDFRWERQYKTLHVLTKICRDGRFVLAGMKRDMTYDCLSVSGTRTANDPEGKAYWPYVERTNVAPWDGERRFVLDDAARVSGRVINARTGEPIREFKLCTTRGKQDESQLGYYGDDYFKSVQHPEGRFSCAAYRGPTTVIARAKTYVSGLVHVDTPTSGKIVEADLRLEPGGTIEGTVINRHGEPIRNAYIFDGPVPKDSTHAKKGAALVRSDQQGRFHATVLPGERVFSVWASDEGGTQAQASVAAGKTTAIDFVFGGGARVSGLVTKAGRPVAASVSCTVHGDDGVPETGSVYARDGRYQISGLPAGQGTLKFRRLRMEAAVPVQISDTYGRYLFEYLCRTFTYLELVSLDCAITDEKTFGELCLAANKELDMAKRGDKARRLESRFRRVSCFLDYLEREEESEIQMYGHSIEEPSFVAELRAFFEGEKPRILASAARRGMNVTGDGNLQKR